MWVHTYSEGGKIRSSIPNRSVACVDPHVPKMVEVDVSVSTCPKDAKHRSSWYYMSVFI